MSLFLAQYDKTIADLKAAVREIEDFPRKGIFTQDVMQLFSGPGLFRPMILELASLVRPLNADIVAGVYSRGWMLGAPLAHELEKPFLPIPKSLQASPSALREKYVYEYSKDELALEPGVIAPGQRVLIVDDQMATGGTMQAAINLIERQGGVVVGCAFILVQTRYDGPGRLSEYPMYALFEKNAQE